MNPGDNPESNTQQKLSRREVLKTIIAGSGALAATAFLPSRWIKPVVEAGVLPAHAQSSVVCDATVTIVRVASGTAPLGFTAYCSYTPTTTPPTSISATIGNLLGFTAYCSYTPTTTPPTSISATIGNLHVTSGGLTPTSAGNFTFNFAR